MGNADGIEHQTQSHPNQGYLLIGWWTNVPVSRGLDEPLFAFPLGATVQPSLIQCS